MASQGTHAVCAGVFTTTLELSSTVGRTVRIVHISDTHTLLFDDIPPGDILVHSGDALETGSDEELADFREWLAAQPHTHKIVLPGNHECGIDKFGKEDIRTRLCGTNANHHLLLDDELVVEGLSFYGTPWNNSTSDDAAFALDDEKRAEKWASIPTGVDILVTHVPPFNVLDLRHKLGMPGGPCPFCEGREHPDWFHWGCTSLRSEVLDRVRPKLHMFGHVHDSTGLISVGGTLFSNAAMVTHRKPCIIDVSL